MFGVFGDIFGMVTCWRAEAEAAEAGVATKSAVAAAAKRLQGQRGQRQEGAATGAATEAAADADRVLRLVYLKSSVSSSAYGQYN